MPCAARSEYTVLEAMSKKVRAFAVVRTVPTWNLGFSESRAPSTRTGTRKEDTGQTAGDGTWPWKKKEWAS